MNTGPTKSFRARLAMTLDLVLIVLLSALAGVAQYSVREGRALLSADSLQYLDNAEALLQPGGAPSFAYRKPGYSLFLAGLMAGFGPRVAPIVVAQYALLTTLPLCAYALGRCLHSRGLGWLAAVLTIARLRDAIWPERVMSEVLYAVLLSTAVVLIANTISLAHGAMNDACKAPRNVSTSWETCEGAASLRLMSVFGAGIALALAWFVRPVALVILPPAILCLLWRSRVGRSRGLAVVALLTGPLAGAMAIECAFNARAGGPLRPCTGTLGAMTLMRARHIENLPLHDSPAIARCLELLPERDADDAYRGNHVDTWIARAHAMRDHGMNDWEIDRLFARAGRELLARQPGTYLTTGLRMFARTLLRRQDGTVISRPATDQLRPIVQHPDASDDRRYQDHWFAYWSLSHRSPEEGRAFFEKWQTTAMEKKPLDSRVVDALRYYFMTPTVADAFAVLRDAGSLWPGFAILLCGVIGLNRRACLFLGLCYLLDAVLVGAFGASEPANARYQWVWIVPDTSLAAGLFVPLMAGFRTGDKSGVDPVCGDRS